MKIVLRLFVVVVVCAIPVTYAGTNCGNGQYEPTGGEECDDGNSADGDGCSSSCLLEDCGNGSIDPYEECEDAQGACCERCHFVPNFTLCRSSQGDCDLNDYCTGNSAVCFDFDRSGELCRVSGGVCDVEEYCDASSPDCPPDLYATGNRCRESFGACDLPEDCDGSSAECPTDLYASGSVCRTAAGVCDQEERCDGAQPGCPADEFLYETPCRASTGQCDPGEYCLGQSPDCPDDYTIPTYDPCDDGDACTTSEICYQDGVCAGYETAPDPAENCIPPPPSMVSWWTADNSPNDIKGGNDGMLQNDATYESEGRVYEAFKLDGSGDGIFVGDRPTLRITTALTIDAWIYFHDVPNDSLAAIVSKWFQGDSAAYLFTVEPSGPGTYRLRAFFRLAGGNEPSILGGTLVPERWYHVAVTFNSSSGYAALWINGHPIAVTPIATEPLNAGTADFTIGYENDFTGRFFHGLIDEVEVFDRALTGDELLAIHDACGNGKCRVCDVDADCDDHNQCTNDYCFHGTCGHGVDDTNECSDGNACTAFDECRDGQCVCGVDSSGAQAALGDPTTSPCAILCLDDTLCTLDSCDPAVGCVATPQDDRCDDHKPCTDDQCIPGEGCRNVPDDSNGCDDGNACTIERCRGGECAESPLPCDDSNACTVDSCDPATGSCVHMPKMCSPSDTCHNAGTCNPSTGTCSNPAKPTGSACDDGNACTRTDTCQSGSCRGTSPVTCSAQDSCHSAGVCDRTTGQCSNPVKPNGTTCSDGTLCTKTDKCQAGVCTGTPVVCGPPDSCHDPGTCNPSTGYCSNPAKPNGSSCSDGNACTRADACSNGYCRGSDPVVCGASDSCHKAGVCSTTTGVCSDPIKPNGSSCSDGNSCTVGDVCSNGACRPGSPPRCAPCTLNGDATVKQSNQYSNYGYANELQARGTTPAWALLRFHVTGVTGQPVTGVHVRLTVKSLSATYGGSIHRVACSWYESSVSWSSKPALSPPLDTEGAVVQGQVVDFDVSSVVTADGDYCFAVDNPAGGDVLYYSREASTGRPQIVVDAGCACVP